MPTVFYNSEQISRYHQRIHYQGSLEPSLENLRKLHYQHLLHIPYENLDQMNNIPLSLDPEALFQKMINNQRGGYCFELQGLFYYLLKSMGYSVCQYAGRFMTEPWHIQMRRHRVLVVTLEGKRYVCDVGVRQESSRYPLLLHQGLVQSDGIAQYRYDWDSFYGWVLMQKLPEKEWKPILGFTEEPQIDEDYVMASFYCEEHPDSTFNKFMKLSIFTESANLTIVENEFKIFQNGKTTLRQPITSHQQARQLLLEQFGISVPEHYSVLLYHR